MKPQLIEKFNLSPTFQPLERRVLLSTNPITFAPSVSTYGPTSYTSLSLVGADLNGDGIEDLVVTGGEHSSPGDLNGVIYVLMGNGNGTFQAPVSYALPYQSNSIAIGDINGDGIPDIIAACSQRGGFEVLFGGAGSFSGPFSSGGQGYNALVTGNINNDGFADVAGVQTPTNNDVVVGLGQAEGGPGGDQLSQQEAFLQMNGYAVAIALADVNGDGNTDLILDSSHGVEVYLGNGKGEFDKTPTVSPSIPYVSGISVSDINGDGRPDLAIIGVLFGNHGTYHDEVEVLDGNGDGTFKLGFTHYVQEANAVAIADLNGDGFPDVVIAGTSDIELLQGNGDGTFSYGIVNGSKGGDSMVVADLNGDGLPDIVGVGPSILYTSINTSPNPPLLSFSITNHILTVTANGDNPDDILLSRTGGIISLSDAGDVTTYDASTLSQINIDTGDGNDLVTIEPGIGLPVSVNGGAGHDVLAAHGPNLTLAGGKGWDNLTAHGQDDLLIGGLGNDTITAGPTPTDTLRGGAGNDSITGGGLLLAGIGEDTLVQLP